MRGAAPAVTLRTKKALVRSVETSWKSCCLKGGGLLGVAAPFRLGVRPRHDVQAEKPTLRLRQSTGHADGHMDGDVGMGMLARRGAIAA